MMNPITSDDILYHYTDEAGLRGIFRSGKFWATSITHETDKREFTYTLDLAHKVIIERLEQAVSPAEKVFLERIEKELPREVATVLEYQYIFVGSFCREQNLPHLWKEYGEFNIGFDASQLTEPDRGFYLMKCIYQPEEQKNIIRGYLMMALTEGVQITEIVQNLYLYAVKFKAPSFSKENEWRLVSHRVYMKAEKRLDLRDLHIGSEPQPHFRYPLTVGDEKLKVNKLIIGSGPNQQQSIDLAHSIAKEFSDRVIVKEIIPI